jgi:ABC-type nickel/cobalt efflux system permease component RcnA
LSTKLQEVAVASGINLSLAQILCFNVGVEFGQIAVLIILFPLLSLLRGKSFDRISKISNRLLVIAGIVLLVYQVNGYFTDDTHHHQHEQHIEVDTTEQEQKHEHSHGDGHSHSH